MRLFRSLPAGVAVSLVALLSGCATIVSDKTATISVDAPDCPPGTVCTLTNKKGSWTVQPPGTITIPKSDDTLQVNCRTPSGQQLVQSGESRLGGMFWGNIIFGGGIGMIADANTDAHREYPASIVVPGCLSEEGKEE